MQYVISDSDITITGKTYTGAVSALAMNADGRPNHTFRTATLLADGNRVHFNRCTFENTAGPGKIAGQAIALYLDGDDITLSDCKIIGHQDTLFLAPLPLKERQKNGFLGPKQFTERKDHTFHFKNCYIEGGVDFIFGGATAYFEDCEFKSVEPGYVFAPNTPEHVKTGFVARNCKFTCTDSVPYGSCFAARPWRDFAKVTIEDCELGRHINERIFTGWGKKEWAPTVEFNAVNCRALRQ